MSAPFCIDARILGTKRHLLSDSGWSWVDEHPTGIWRLSGVPGGMRSLDDALHLAGQQLSLEPDGPWPQIMRDLVPSSSWPPPWQHVMPSRDHQTFVKKITNSIEGFLTTGECEYYNTVWEPSLKIFDELERAAVDVRRHAELIATAQNLRPVQSFKPDANGLANPIKYNRFATRTGRMTVQSGPEILTLNRDYRDLIKSRRNGSIFYLDFSALEVRILLYEAGRRCDDADLYSMLADDLFRGMYSRDIVKGVVISEVYGMGTAALSEKLGLSGDDLRDVITGVKRYFRTTNLKKKLREDYARDGYIKNRYGRIVKIDDPLDHIFVNSYAQSTGVDVVTLGFSSIVDDLRKIGAAPLYILHDALIIDCPNSGVENLKRIKSVKVKGYVQSFPLSLNTIGCTH